MAALVLHAVCFLVPVPTPTHTEPVVPTAVRIRFQTTPRRSAPKRVARTRPKRQRRAPKRVRRTQPQTPPKSLRPRPPTASAPTVRPSPDTTPESGPESRATPSSPGDGPSLPIGLRRPEIEAPPAKPRGLRRRSNGTYVYDAGPFKGVITPNGDFYFEDIDLQVAPTGTFRFDLTDSVMRALGDDPYVHRKMNFVRETAEFRAWLRRTSVTTSLERAVLGMRDRLDTIWRRSDLDRREKKVIFFEIWDGAIEHGARKGYGDFVRASVRSFIRRRLPPGTPGSYTREELEHFNRISTSLVPFQPYD